MWAGIILRGLESEPVEEGRVKILIVLVISHWSLVIQACIPQGENQ